jgi:hypothetical protein
VFVFAVPGLHQISNAGFGSINSPKGFRLLQTEASHTDVTPRGLHLARHLIDRLRNLVHFSWFRIDSPHGAAYGRALTSQWLFYSRWCSSEVGQSCFEARRRQEVFVLERVAFFAFFFGCRFLERFLWRFLAWLLTISIRHYLVDPVTCTSRRVGKIVNPDVGARSARNIHGQSVHA